MKNEDEAGCLIHPAAFALVLWALWVLGVRHVKVPCKCSLRLTFPRLRQTNW